jgi:hypothetical protein
MGNYLRKAEDSAVAKRRRTVRARPTGDGGSVLLEVVIAFSLFAVVILAAGSGLLVSTAAASSAKQRSVAFTLVSADVANATSLPFADLTAGLNPTVDSLSSDPNIQTSGSTYTLKLTGATLATTNSNSSESPLVPHITTITASNVSYKVSTYPQTGSNGVVTVVVIVSWTSALGGKTQVVGESQVAAP